MHLGGPPAQHFNGRGRQAATPQGKPLGRCGKHRRHFAGCPEAVYGCHHHAIALSDIAERAQMFAPGINMAAARLE